MRSRVQINFKSPLPRVEQYVSDCRCFINLISVDWLWKQELDATKKRAWKHDHVTRSWNTQIFLISVPSLNYELFLLFSYLSPHKTYSTFLILACVFTREARKCSPATAELRLWVITVHVLLFITTRDAFDAADPRLRGRPLPSASRVSQWLSGRAPDRCPKTMGSIQILSLCRLTGTMDIY